MKKCLSRHNFKSYDELNRFEANLFFIRFLFLYKVFLYSYSEIRHRRLTAVRINGLLFLVIYFPSLQYGIFEESETF